MKLYEYQAKELLAKFGILTPAGQVAASSDEAVRIAAVLGLPLAIKAQVQVGGRGKAGGIKIARTIAEVSSLSQQILNMKIKELPVKKVLLEQAVDIEKEYYLGIIVDRANKGNTLIFSTVGGIDIEEVARTEPDKILKFEIRNKFKTQISEIPNEIIDSLIKMYFAVDATLAEINPLVITKSGKVIAADAKIIIDDNALFRHPEFSSISEGAETDPIEAEAQRRKIAYVRLPGNVGIIGNGAGLVMSTMDEVKRAGGSPADFLDIGGGAKADVVKSTLELLLMDKNIKGIFFNVFGGITRCDEVAKGLIAAIDELKIKLPIVIRLTGTRSAEGCKLIAETKLLTASSMQEGARKIVEHISQ
ncbi:ADP-forming succinate--CoA ligase subunit beta [Candidatus Saganbacteria bacterium]|nr:ADP-forming succinate--CoA ligase subunit beta [Candidatus Saganbacteria bacterium]